MFSSYDMKSFGVALRTIRESLNLTRKQVSEHLDMYTDTLRKIELGSVIPRYDSLEMLPQLYKIDILNLLRIHIYNSNLEKIYESLDSFLIEDKTEKIIELKHNETKM